MSEQISPHDLEQIMRDHGAALELFAAQWTNQPEDCVQEALLQLVRERTVPHNTLAWLYRVVRNRAISWQRSFWRRRRRESVVATQRPLWSLPPGWRAAELEEVTQALWAIDPQLREVVVSRIWGGLSFEQIAEVVEASTSTAHRRYQAGLQQLRERLEVRCKKNISSTEA